MFQNEVTFQIGDRYVQVTDGRTTLCLRLGDGEPFNLGAAIPVQYQEVFFVSPKDVLNALAYIKGFITKKIRPCIRLCDGILTIAELPQKCSTTLKLSGNNSMPIGFYIRFMEDAMKQFKHEPQVKVNISGRNTPIIVEAEGRSDHALVMPARLKENASAA